MNILHITPDFNYACGRSYYVYLLMKYLSKSGHNTFLLTNGGDSFDRLSELNLKYSIFESLHSKNPVSLAKSLKKVKGFIREYNVDIVHTHHRYSELLAILAVNGIKSKKVKTVFTSLSFVHRKYKVEYRSDRIIAVSNAVKKMLVEKFCVAEKKIHIINNFTDTAETYELGTASVKAKENQSYNILSVGRFHSEKNYETLLGALHFLNDRHLKLYLVGEGKNLKKYKEIVKQNALNVEFVKPRKNLQEYFLLADICVLSSSRDPFPNFMLQSGLHCKPFIGTNVDGISELIRHKKNGLLFEPGNYMRLAENIDTFRTDQILASECAANLHSDVMNNYTQDSIIPKIEKLYYDLHLKSV